jgi:hypothetical protein
LSRRQIASPRGADPQATVGDDRYRISF